MQAKATREVSGAGEPLGFRNAIVQSSDQAKSKTKVMAPNSMLDPRLAMTDPSAINPVAKKGPESQHSARKALSKKPPNQMNSGG